MDFSLLLLVFSLIFTVVSRLLLLYSTVDKKNLLSQTMGHFPGFLISSAGIQKLFCGIYSAFKCSFDEFVAEKVVYPSYSSAILGPPPLSVLITNGILEILL